MYIAGLRFGRDSGGDVSFASGPAAAQGMSRYFSRTICGAANLRIVDTIPKTPLVFALVLLVLLNVFNRLVSSCGPLCF